MEQTTTKRTSIAGLIESTLPLSLVKTQEGQPPPDMSNNTSSTSGRSSLDHSSAHRPPSRVFSQQNTQNIEPSPRPISLSVDRPRVISPSRDRSPSEVIRVLKDSVFDSDSDSPSHTSRPLQPRRATGSEWNPKSRSQLSSESDVVSFHEVLKQLDEQEE